MQEKFYVSHETQQMGPYGVEEIVSFVRDGTLSPLDYLYDEHSADWVLFLEHPRLSEKIKALKPKTPPKSEQKTPEVSKKTKNPIHKDAEQTQEWFVLKGENKFGPFSFADLVKMLQQGVVYEFDFVWREGIASWTRVAEQGEFSKDNIKKLQESGGKDMNQVFFRRRFKRIKFGGTILVHDNKAVWKGRAVEMSEGGAGIIMENAMVLPGQELYLHFKPGDGVPPFNAVCEVVSKAYTTDLTDRKAPIKYGLKFKSMTTDAEKIVKEFTKKAA